MRAETSPSIGASAAFACEVCGARLDDAHLEFARDGSHCAFCGASQSGSRGERADAVAGSLDIGDTLHGARLDRGETLEQAAHFTRIQLGYLRALEHDDASVFEPFPGMAYARYFLRDYAEHLGVDPAPLVRRFDRELTEPVVVPVERPVFRMAPRPRRWALGALVLLVALLAGSALWTRRDTSPHDPAAPARPGPARTAATGAATGGHDTHPSAAPRTHGLSVIVRTTDQPSWVAATLDGALTQETLPPHTVRRWRAHHDVTLRLGNAGAVVLTVNGDRVPTGSDGAVVEIQIRSRDGRVVVR